MSTDLFGNVHLGYAVIETNKFDDWRRFGREAIGMHLDEMQADTIRFRLDANESRFLLRRGPAEDVVALGWHLDDHATFDEICRRVIDHGVPAVEGSDDDAKLRGVERFLHFPGPHGLAQGRGRARWGWSSADSARDAAGDRARTAPSVGRWRSRGRPQRCAKSYARAGSPDCGSITGR